MWFELMLRDEYRKGISEGEVKGKVEDILDLLDELGVVSSSLRQQILQETDPMILKAMLKAAAKAGSLEQFETNLFDKFKIDLSKSIQNKSK